MSATRRAALLVVGLSVFSAYAAGAAVVAWALVSVWRGSFGLPTTLALVVGLTLVFGLASHQYAVRGFLANVTAVELTRETSPRLYERVDAVRTELSVGEPTVYVADLEEPNALALARLRGGAVVVDRGLFDLLSPDEFTAILAHELAHIESYDGLVQTLAYSLLRTVVGLLVVVTLPLTLLFAGAARGTAWALGRPERWSEGPFAVGQRVLARGILGLLVLFTVALRAHSRRREFAADDRAVAATGDPLALARALAKIHRAAGPEWRLVAPLYVDGDGEPDHRVLSTHPPMRERVDRLVRFARHGPERP